MNPLRDVAHVAVHRAHVSTIPYHWFPEIVGQLHFDDDTRVEVLIEVGQADVGTIQEVSDIDQEDYPREGKGPLLNILECLLEPLLEDAVELESFALRD